MMRESAGMSRPANRARSWEVPRTQRQVHTPQRHAINLCAPFIPRPPHGRVSKCTNIVIVSVSHGRLHACLVGGCRQLNGKVAQVIARPILTPRDARIARVLEVPVHACCNCNSAPGKGMRSCAHHKDWQRGTSVKHAGQQPTYPLFPRIVTRAAAAALDALGASISNTSLSSVAMESS